MLNTATIEQGEMLRLIERTDDLGQPIPFSMRRFTFNRRERTGGEIEVRPNVISSQAQRRHQAKKGASNARGKDTLRRQDHYKNATRNLIDLDSGETFKVHVDWITHINGKEVV